MPHEAVGTGLDAFQTVYRRVVSCLEDQQDRVVWAVPEDRVASVAP